MDYNYTDDPYYADVVDGELVIKHVVIAEEAPHDKTTTTHKFDITGLTVHQVDTLTRQKIQELNG